MSAKQRVFNALDGLIKCDRAIVCSVFLWYLALLPCVVEVAARSGICAMDGCNCSTQSHRWIHIKCVFSKEQNVELQEGLIPQDTKELEISHCRELRIQTGAFGNSTFLAKVFVSRIGSVVAKRQALQNMSVANTNLNVLECNSVLLESHAFMNLNSTMRVSISRCKHVEIKPSAFSWLLSIEVKDVPSLELSSNAFKFEAPEHGRHGPATTINFQNVKIMELPTAAFPSALSKITMDNIEIKVIRNAAFCAMNIFKVIVSNATINEIQSGAFSDKAFISNLEFIDVEIKNIHTAAFRASHDNLTIQHSRLSEVDSGAINSQVAVVTFSKSEFRNLQRNSIGLHEWNNITIDQNFFVNLESDAIKAELNETSNPNFEFSFTGNRIARARPGSLRFAAISQKANTARIGNNYFSVKCNCELENWVREITGRNGSTTWMMDSSYCEIDRTVFTCPNLPDHISMGNFSRLICSPEHHVQCDKPPSQPTPTFNPPNVGPHVYPRPKSFFDMELSEAEQLEREKRIIVIVCLVAAFIVAVAILTSGILYMRKRSICPKFTSVQLSSLMGWFSPSSGMTAATSARSISRMSVHEYAGLQPETRILEVEPQEAEATEGYEEDGNVYPYTETKATQTLPEELTEEYLRDLRERLNDPDNYSQARDMIEHLYDLIKVEESCNNNNNRRPVDEQEENAYDVIQPRIRRPRGPPRPSVTIGTKAPSLEKLLPNGIQARPPITEYTQPRDQRTSDQNHLYAELPGDETVPSTSRLSQPILECLIGRAPQPLPPDVVNDHLVMVGDPRNYGFNGEDEPPQSPRLDSCRNYQTRPMNFLKALSESIRGATNKMNGNKRPNSLLCEYAEPSDVTAHLYSELPEPRTSASTSKMANRPLPTKPDQDPVAASAVKA